MTIGYDPFKYADNWESEEEYLQELENEERNKPNELFNSNERTSANN